MRYAHLHAGIASWWGQGSKTDQRVPLLLNAARGTGLKWTVYYEREGYGDPAVSRIESDLAYLYGHYATSPAWLWLGGKPGGVGGPRRGRRVRHGPPLVAGQRRRGAPVRRGAQGVPRVQFVRQPAEPVASVRARAGCR